jgi:hypothetical protein
MNIVIFVSFILLIVVVAYLVKIEKHLSEVVRIQRATSPSDIARRLKNEELEALLFSRFMREDSSRVTLDQHAQIEAFKQWKITNA